MADFGAYGLAESASAGTASGFEPLMREIHARGFAALPAVLPDATIDRLNAVMDEVYARQCAEVGGEAALAAMNDADIARCLLAYSGDYMALATHPTLTGVARAILGENVVLLMQNGVISRSGKTQAQARWHRDLNYQHWVCSRAISLSVLVCLEDFSPGTGGTAFLPGSHLAEEFPSPARVAEDEVTPVLPRGSMIFFNSMTFHRGGVNSSGRIRRAVNHVIGAPILAQVVDIPAMLDREPPADPWLAGYLGYRWNPTRDVAAWRRQRIAQATGAA
jgi:ectoine hydroxylase-related dioxygenase (phytanoyl-CoA dioxygenase family)